MVRTLAIVLLVTGCDATVADGVFRCDSDGDCPSEEFSCRPIADMPGISACFRGGGLDAGLDAGPDGGSDAASDAPLDADPGDTSDTDAGPDVPLREAWVATFGGPADQTVHAIAVHADGSVYVGGAYEGGGFVESDPSCVDPAATAAFLMRLDETGETTGARCFVSNTTTSLGAEVHGLAVDGEDVFLAATFNGRVDFGQADPDLESWNQDVMVARYEHPPTGIGDASWAFNRIRGGGFAWVTDLDVGVWDGGSRRIAVTGGYTNALDFNVESFPNAEPSTANGWVAVFNDMGQIAARGVAAVSGDKQRFGVAVGRTKLFVAGRNGPSAAINERDASWELPVEGAFAFSGDARTNSIDATSAGFCAVGEHQGQIDFGEGLVGRDMRAQMFFVCNGGSSFTSTFASEAGFVDGEAIEVEGGTAWIAGMAAGTVDFDGFTLDGSEQGFVVARSTTDGSHVLGVSFANGTTLGVEDIAVTPDRIYVSGWFTGAMTFAGRETVSTSVDGFVAAFNRAGDG